MGNVSVTFDHRVVDGVRAGASRVRLRIVHRRRLDAVPDPVKHVTLSLEMGDWYEIGITVGIGVAAGIAFAGVLAGLRFGFATTLLGALVVGVVAGLLVNGWIGVGGGVVGAVIGSVSAAAIVRGANRRGATAAARPSCSSGQRSSSASSR